MEPKGNDMADELDEALDAACRANIHPLSEPSDVERRKMRRALEAALPHLLARLSRPSTAATDDMVAAFIAAFYGIDPDDVWTKQDRYADVFRGLNAALTHPSPQGGTEPDGRLADLLERLDAGCVRTGEGDNGEELYGVDDASDAMFEAASEIRALLARPHPIGETGGTDDLVERLTKVADEFSDKSRDLRNDDATRRGYIFASDLVKREAIKPVQEALTSLRAERDAANDQHQFWMNDRDIEFHKRVTAESSLAAEKLKTAELTAISEAAVGSLEQRVAALVGALNEIQEMARGWHSEGYSPVEAIDNIDSVAVAALATEA